MPFVTSTGVTVKLLPLQIVVAIGLMYGLGFTVTVNEQVVAGLQASVALQVTVVVPKLKVTLFNVVRLVAVVTPLRDAVMEVMAQFSVKFTSQLTPECT